jgi:hypothetical protein
MSPVLCADIDGDGAVGIADFNIWRQQFLKCHDGSEEVECP